MNTKILLEYRLLKTTRRLTFDIIFQCESVTHKGSDEDGYLVFNASNGYEVISRSRMDIQTERIWLLGAASFTGDVRSGTMVFSDDTRRDSAYLKFINALNEWAFYNHGEALMRGYDYETR